MRLRKFQIKSIAIIAFLWLLLAGVYAAHAQPPAAAAMKPAEKSASTMAVMKPAAMASASVMQPSAMSAETAGKEKALAKPAESMATSKEEPKAKDKSADSQAAFWITNLVTPVVLLILGIVFRFVSKDWLKKEKTKLVLQIIRDGVKSFLKYAENTEAEWDDAAGKLVNDVCAYLIAQGEEEPTEDEKKKFKAVADKQKEILGPDAKPKDEEKKAKKG